MSSGLSGGLETRPYAISACCDGPYRTSTPGCSDAALSAYERLICCEASYGDRAPSLQQELRPDRGVIGWFFPLPHLPLDSARAAFLRETLTRQHGIDPQSAVLRERQ